MIGHFPIVLMVPGLLFVMGGFFYYSRAAEMDEESELGKILVAANRRTGNLSVLLGAILLIIGVPLGLAIKQIYS